MIDISAQDSVATCIERKELQHVFPALNQAVSQFSRLMEAACFFPGKAAYQTSIKAHLLNLISGDNCHRLCLHYSRAVFGLASKSAPCAMSVDLSRSLLVLTALL